MSAVDGQVAAVVAVDVPFELAGRVAERFTALAAAHGGKVEPSDSGLVATFPAVPNGLAAAAELLLSPESPRLRCGIAPLGNGGPAAIGFDVAVMAARRLCSRVEPGQLVMAAQVLLDEPQIVGRESELHALSDALTAAESGRPQVLTLRGDLGSGRTTLLAHLANQAHDRGFRVINVRGVAGAMTGRWSSLRVAAMVGGDRATRLAERLPSLAGDNLPDDAAMARDLLAFLSREADRQPLLLAIDDIDHVDPASRSALRAVAAGLAVERCLLVASGPGGPEEWLGGTVMSLRNLPDEALERIIQGDGPVDPAVLRRCVRLAAGNPLAAREVSRSLTPRQRGGQEALPLVPEPAAAVLAGFRELLASSSHAAQLAAVVAAADDTGDCDVVRAALVELGEDPTGLEQAEESGLINIDGSGLRFKHPLLRSVAYHQVAAGSRRAAHRALAVALDRPRQATARAYQLAAAAAGPNENASEALALVAETELSRGDALAAAHASALSARLTADDSLRDQRLTRAASLYLRSGDFNAVDAALSELSSPPSVPDAVLTQGMVDLAREGPARARTNLDRLAAASELSGVRQGLGAHLAALAGEPTNVADPASPLTIAARVLSGLEPAATLIGLGRSPGALGALEASVAAHALSVAGWLAEAAAMVSQLEIDAEAIDPESVRATAGHLALDAGRPLAALEILGDAAVALSAGATPSACLRLLALSRARLYCGRLDDAEESLRSAAAIVDRLGVRGHQSELDLVRGLVLHARGLDRGGELLARAGATRPDRALPELVLATLDRRGSTNPDWIPQLELLVQSPDRRGSLTARRALAALREDTEELTSVAKQCAEVGLVLESVLTRGAMAATAVRLGTPDANRLRSDAVQEAALLGMVHPGCRYWDGTGVQDRLRDKLSPAEHRVAVAVGTGATNKEVSSKLFISVKTVDYHLQNIYRKLGARSRTELAVLLAGNGPDPGSDR